MIEKHLIGRLDDLADPGSREFAIQTAHSSLRGFVVRKRDTVFAYVNRCPHAGHILNRSPDSFLSVDREKIMCRSHGALFAIDTGVCVEGICLGERLQRIPVHLHEGLISLAYDAVQARWVETQDRFAASEAQPRK